MPHKNFLSLFILLSVLASPDALSANVVQNHSFKIKGELHSQLSLVSQQKDFRRNLDVGKSLSGNDQLYNSGSLANNCTLKLLYANRAIKSLEYGASVKIDLSTSKDITNIGDKISSEANIYIRGDFGRIEMGTTSPVSSLIAINSYSFARATGGLNGDWNIWLRNGGVIRDSSGKNSYSISNNYITVPQLTAGLDYNANNAAKVNYFSPKFNGFLFGLSFTPDSKVKGTTNQVARISKDSYGGYRNIWQFAASYQKLINKVRLITTLTNEFGKAKKVSYYNDINNLHFNQSGQGSSTRYDLKAYQISGSVDYKGLVFTTSYGYNGKSGSIRSDQNSNKNSQYWSFSSAHSTDTYGISLNYMQSKKLGTISSINDSNLVKFNEKEYNRFKALSIGADYLLMPGFTQYAEVTKFRFLKNQNFDNYSDKVKFNNGVVILTGIKLNF